VEPVDLRTERLVLDQPTTADLERIVAYCRDPLFERYMTLPWPYQEKDAVFFVDSLVPGGWRDEREFTWALRKTSSGPLLGVVGMRTQPEPRTLDVGYWLGAPSRGNGYMVEAVRAVTGWAFAARGIETVLWECVAGNCASVRVARGAGFAYAGAGAGRIVMRDGSPPYAWTGALQRDGDRSRAAASWPAETLTAASDA
jgi:RimJ/RimL family protein N-acetyltransferase